MVRAFASNQCGPDSRIPGPGVICGLSLLLVLVLVPRVFLRVLRFSSLHKNQHFRIPIRPGRQMLHMSPWLRRLGDFSLHYDVRFALPFFLPHSRSASRMIGILAQKWFDIHSNGCVIAVKHVDHITALETKINIQRFCQNGMKGNS